MPTNTPARRLEVFRSRSDNSEVIVCHGWLDASTCEQLQNEIDHAYDGGVHRLRVDLANVLGIDQTGLSCLVNTSRHCRSAGIALEVQSSVHIHEVLVANGIVDVAP